MKRILITGDNSYIGMAVEKHLAAWPDDYQVDTVSLLDDAWKERSFSGYDTVFHVAGIAHDGKSKNDPSKADLYYRVNTLLAEETAKKAKADGVSQFIFMSSASVYGSGAAVGKEMVITADTPLTPADNYGISKAKAEQALQQLHSEAFRVAIVRPPIIYGKGCKGNYPTLSKLARLLPVFPKVNNRRSMLYIENFAEFVRLLVDNGEEGIFWPQNAEYVSTSDLAVLIRQTHGKKVLLLGGVTWALKLMSHVTGMVNRAFGSMYYDRELSRYKENYCIKNLAQSIFETES